MKKNQLIAIGLLFLCVLAVTACSSSNIQNNSSSWPGVTADGSVVYTANGNLVEAVQDGRKIWSYPEPANNRVTYYAAPAVSETHVFAGTYSNQLHIINKADGTLAASIEVGNNKNKIIASPIVAGEDVIVLSSGGMVSSYPVNAAGESITPNWQTTLSSEVWVKPVYNDGTLYVASMDKKMNLLDAATGELKQTIGISGAIMNDPILADGKLYFSTLAKEVDEMDLSNNEIRSLLKTDGEIWASPLLMENKLVAADMAGVVYCVDIASGEQVWKSERLTAANIGFIASPIALDEKNIVLVDESGVIHTYDMDGKSGYERSMSASVYSTPVLLENGTIVILPVSNDGQIRAFTSELKEDWVYNRSDKAENSSEPVAESTEESQEAK